MSGVNSLLFLKALLHACSQPDIDKLFHLDFVGGNVSRCHNFYRIECSSFYSRVTNSMHIIIAIMSSFILIIQAEKPC